jgi:hypothetical protein
MMVATAAGGLVYYAGLPRALPAIPDDLHGVWALPAAAAVMYAANAGAVAGMAGLQLGHNPLVLWRSGLRVGFLPTAAPFLAGLVVALSAAGTLWGRVAGGLLLVLLLAAVHQALRRAQRLLEAERRARAEADMARTVRDATSSPTTAQTTAATETARVWASTWAGASSPPTGAPWRWSPRPGAGRASCSPYRLPVLGLLILPQAAHLRALPEQRLQRPLRYHLPFLQEDDLRRPAQGLPAVRDGQHRSRTGAPGARSASAVPLTVLQQAPPEEALGLHIQGA